VNITKTLLITLAVVSFQASAETAYRSIDAEGNVIFSDEPVNNAAETEKVTIDAPVPSAESRQEALQKEADLLKEASQVETPRAPANPPQQESAEQRVEDAEKQLEEAQQVREGDRIGTAHGGSRLTPEYQERVREAESELEQAKEAAE
jgi:hypothetical protein